MTVVEPKIEADATSASPMGDDYDPATGTITLSATDISLPGNFDIPVELRRWVPNDDFNTGGPMAGGWNWNIPFIRGHFLDVKDGQSAAGWDWGYNTWRHGKNCSGAADSVINSNGDFISGDSYWQGKRLHIPGVTSETFLDKPNGDQVTKSNFKIISCIENANGQQGIVVAGPNGLTYTFNQIKTYYNGKAALKSPIIRTRLLLVTKIEDRFGNHVDYSYTSGGNLSQISASDGRLITVGATTTAHGRTWNYAAITNGLAVTLPDGSQWKYEGTSSLTFKPNGIGVYNQQLRIGQAGSGQGNIIPGCGAASSDYIVTVTTPGGLLATYTFRDTVHYRSKVDPDTYTDVHDPDMVVTRALACTISRSLVSKTITGPGIATASWTYQYSGNRGTYTTDSGINGYLTGPFNLAQPAVGGYPAPITAGNADDYRSTTITGPEKKLVFYIDRKFQSVGENRVIAHDTLNAAGTQLLERTQSTFALGDYVGYYWSPQSVNGYQLSYRINQTQAQVKRYVSGGTDTFTTTYGNFDAYGFAQTSQGSNSFSGNVRTVQSTYLHDSVNGLLGLPLTETVNGVLATEHHYTAQGLRDWTKAFGKVQASLTYDTTATVGSGQRGTLKTVTDGNGNTSTFTNWKRGIPQSAVFADATTRAAVINDSGWITSVTDENGYQTCYGFDAMGRLAKIEYPNEATGACDAGQASWKKLTRSFVPVASAEYGIPAGHWRETVTTGNATKITYYDGLWRPLLVREYDAGNQAGTERFSKKAYDADGRVTFASYPSTSSAPTTGVWTEYDPLGRVELVSQDSELGPLETFTEHLTGFRTRVTNPRNQSTTTSYMTYDQPTTDWPVSIAAPENATTTITRDAFGKPLTLTRSGGGVTPLVRYYAYNPHQELCKNWEPETRGSVFAYDLAGNLTQSASGLNTVSQDTTSCNADQLSAGRTVTRTYDSRNRLSTLSFPDGNGNQTWTYTNDSLPQSVSTNNSGNTVSNSYTYNKRRLLTGEAMVPDTIATGWGIGYGYNQLGQVITESLPASVLASYMVNALGQVTQASIGVPSLGTNTVVASGASYFPNGALKQFTYGNGIVHTMTQNARQLPNRSTDGTVLDLATTFDKNGNVTAVTDYTATARQTKSMGYDGLDRLTSASSPMFGSASYSYNTLDNLTRVVVGGPQARDHTYNYGAGNNRLLSVTNTSGGASVIGMTYDLQGNLANKNGVATEFDYGNRLRTTAGLTYRYDADGRRVRHDNAGGQLKYSYYAKDGRLVWQRDEPNAKRIHNVYFAGSLVAEFSRPIAGQTETLTYFHTDALGSPIAKTNSSGAVIETSEYEPYGDLLNRPNDDRAGYTGHVMDAATGLTYMQQRYYDPQIGRFLSVDPVAAFSKRGIIFNRYWYASNNPYAFKDPDGRADVPVWLQKILETTVPGQVTWNHAVESFGQGNYGQAAVQAGVAFAEAGVAIATLGGSHVETTTARALTNVAEAGSIRTVNAVRGATNCVNCAIATDAVLAGRPASALGGGPTSISVLERAFGSSFGARTNIEGITQTMADAGSGARGIVFGSRGEGEVGHVFNVVNQNGTIRFLDGQTGRAAETAGYESFRLLRTDL